MAVLPFADLWRSVEADWSRERLECLVKQEGNSYEIINGVLYVSTSPSYFHQWILKLILVALYEQLERTGWGLVHAAPAGVFMEGCDPVSPDIAVVQSADRAIIRDRGVYGVPTLIVEILSPSHPDLDLKIKRAAYTKAGVPEYWIVRPATRDLLVCWEPDASLSDFGQTRLVHADGVLQSPTLPFEAQIATFFAGAPDTTL